MDTAVQLAHDLMYVQRRWRCPYSLQVHDSTSSFLATKIYARDHVLIPTTSVFDIQAEEGHVQAFMMRHLKDEEWRTALFCSTLHLLFYMHAYDQSKPFVALPDFWFASSNRYEAKRTACTDMALCLAEHEASIKKLLRLSFPPKAMAADTTAEFIVRMSKGRQLLFSTN